MTPEPRRRRTARQRAMLEWYARSARPLPWRRTRDPYALLVSEVMLQQTQAARVAPYWEGWMRRWPSADAVAAAAVPDVLAAWRGLGYNRRALALRDACGVVALDGWPQDLRELPGVGPYTAAAVASFAWDRPVAAVDTNVRRVLSRWSGAPLSPAAAAERAGAALPAGAAATWNQAMMELGATVCRARDAACGACPVATRCRSAGRVVVAPRAPAGARRPFEATDRWARGRVVAALLAGTPLPALAPPRRERVLAGLARDGLVRLTATGEPALP